MIKNLNNGYFGNNENPLTSDYHFLNNRHSVFSLFMRGNRKCNSYHLFNTLCMPIDPSLKFDLIKSEWFVERLEVVIKENIVFFSLKIDFA